MAERRYDVVYGVADNDTNRPTCHVELHFCRDWDDSGGCHGTNPRHGFTWEEARKEVATFHEEAARSWRERKEGDG